MDSTTDTENKVIEEIPKSQEYWAKLTEYEGPLDILLHFVKEEELNIYDIPISKITRDFLGYINYMQDLDIELAGEFLLMAAELMKIKARMLIPQLADNETEEEDPRLTLIRKLLEYKRFKEVAEEMIKFEEQARQRYFRLFFRKDAKKYVVDPLNDFGLQNLTVFNLIKGYRKVITSVRHEFIHPIELLNTTPEIQREFLINFFNNRTSVDYAELIKTLEEKMLVICTFLSILQLALEGFLTLIINNGDPADFSLIKVLQDNLA
ncbi:segregation/condensation protein A [bacterium]|nr:MAG: segregation/condensation protein A [bacterium]